MKKFLSIVMALTIATALAACGSSPRSTTSSAASAAPPSSETSVSSTPTESSSEAELPESNVSTSSDVPSESGPTGAPASSAPEAVASSEPTGPAPDEETPVSAPERNVLVAYFSWSGNTREMASYIAERTGGDLLEIQPATPYPTDYTECGDVALEERDNNERPAIANLPESIDQYDTILIGYPIWWHTAPMIIGTFLESYDLTGVEIYPFTQSDSMDTEQFDNSIAFVRENADGATVWDGLFVRPSNTEAIDRYLSDNGLVR